MTLDELLKWIADNDALLRHRACVLKCQDAIYIVSVMMSCQPKPFAGQLAAAAQSIQQKVGMVQHSR